MSAIELKCPKCGAPVSPEKNLCDYCKAKYIVVGESKAFLFGEYVECNTFKELQFLIEEARKEERTNGKIEMMHALEACKFCHIKNCPFFNKDWDEIHPYPDRFPTSKEIEETLRKFYETHGTS